MDLQQDREDSTVVHSDRIMTVVSRALNLVDGRLVDHGLKVAMVLGNMLDVEGCRDRQLRKTLGILALLHDVGAYRTEEIDDMVRFETARVWEHSIYGYLFLREFTPLEEWARVVLYHHADERELLQEPEAIRRYSQMLHIADRAVVWHDEVKRSPEELREHLERKRGNGMNPQLIDLFWKADERFHVMEALDAPVDAASVLDCSAISGEEAKAYLRMVVHAIDFRSHVTVTHTMSVMEIALRLSRIMGMPKATQEQIYYGGLLHDLGKIGTPVSILEKPGRLTDEEMTVMREHVVLSGQIIDGCVDETVARIALRHHEKLDGSGYPLGLSAEDLTPPERLMAVADIVSALCMSRSYKDAFPKERCLEILGEMRDRGQLDGRIVDVMTQHFDGIMAEVEDACRPLTEAYGRLVEEYRSLLAQKRSLHFEGKKV